MPSDTTPVALSPVSARAPLAEPATFDYGRLAHPPAGRNARLEDEQLGVVTRHLGLLEQARHEFGLAVRTRLFPADEIVRHEAGEVFEVLDAVLAELHGHGRRDAFHLGHFVGDAEFLAHRHRPVPARGEEAHPDELGDERNILRR
mgnify:CR=1 FL=1